MREDVGGMGSAWLPGPERSGAASETTGFFENRRSLGGFGAQRRSTVCGVCLALQLLHLPQKTASNKPTLR